MALIELPGEDFIYVLVSGFSYRWICASIGSGLTSVHPGMFFNMHCSLKSVFSDWFVSWVCYVCLVFV